MSKEEVIEAILFAESESDWEEVERLYKILFKINEWEEALKDGRAFI